MKTKKTTKPASHMLEDYIKISLTKKDKRRLEKSARETGCCTGTQGRVFLLQGLAAHESD